MCYAKVVLEMNIFLFSGEQFLSLISFNFIPSGYHWGGWGNILHTD